MVESMLVADEYKWNYDEIRSTHNCICYSLWQISFWLPALRWQSDWASPKLDGLASAGSFGLTAVSQSIVLSRSLSSINYTI